MKRYLLLLLLLTLFAPALAEEEPVEYKSGDYGYILLDDGTAEITRYTGTDAILRLPETIDGFTVTSLDDDISTMSSYTEVQRIFIPDTITHITGNPFQMFSALTNFVVSPDHPVFAEMEGVLFRKDDKALIAFPNGMRTQTYRVPYGILAIDDYAFAYSKLMMVTMPDSVTSVGAHAFHYCKSLKSITLPDSVTFVGEYAFAHCDMLQSFVIPSSLTTLPAHMFYDCSKLAGVTIPLTVTEIEGNPFTACKRITDFSVAPGHPVFKVIDRVLYDTTRKSVIAAPYPAIVGALRTYTVPDGTAAIAPGAFYGSKLESIAIPDSVRVIGDEAFYSCTVLKKIALPPQLESIGEWALANCIGLTHVTIPDSVTFIGDCAFNRCSGLRSMTLSSGMTAIPDGFLTNSYLLRELTIPDGVTAIGDSALAYCDSLGTVVIPAGVTFIAPDAFEKSPNVTLLVPRESYARQFAVEHGMAYTYEDADSWLN